MASPVLIAVALSACSGGSSSAQQTPSASTNAPAVATSTTTSPKITTTSKPTVDDVVKRRWLAYWDVVATATTQPAESDPRVPQYMTGPALTGLQNVLKQRVRDGIVVRYSNGSDRHVPRVVEVKGTEATVRDCWEDHAVQVREATGKVVNDRVSTVLLSATMILAGSQWKVFRYSIVQEWKTKLADSTCLA